MGLVGAVDMVSVYMAFLGFTSYASHAVLLRFLFPILLHPSAKLQGIRILITSVRHLFTLPGSNAHLVHAHHALLPGYFAFSSLILANSFTICSASSLSSVSHGLSP
jgi:hypothetical protein